MLLHLAPLQAHWGSCKKFWEPEGTKAFIYLYEGEYIAGSKLVQMMWKRKKEKKKRLRRRFLVDCGITCEKKEYTALPFHVRHELNIHTANQNISDSMTVCKVTMWNEWGVPPHPPPPPPPSLRQLPALYPKARHFILNYFSGAAHLSAADDEMGWQE